MRRWNDAIWSTFKLYLCKCGSDACWALYQDNACVYIIRGFLVVLMLCICVHGCTYACMGRFNRGRFSPHGPHFLNWKFNQRSECPQRTFVTNQCQLLQWKTLISLIMLRVDDDARLVNARIDLSRSGSSGSSSSRQRTNS